MKVVMLRPLGLGDFLTGVPAYRAVARAFPLHRRILAAPHALAALADLVPGIDELVDVAPLVPLPEILNEADVAVDLHGRGPESHRVLLGSRPRRLIAFANAKIPESRNGAVWRPDEHEVSRWCRLLNEAGVPCDEDLDLHVPPEPAPPRVHGATIVHPGAASIARRWPVERWVDVVRAERAAGRRTIVTGVDDEVASAYAIAERAGIPASDVFAGRTSLRELAAIVAVAGRVVAGDTGIGHLATAYRVASVLLFGPTSPELWGPPDRPYHRVLWHGSTGDPHAGRVDSGLLQISVAEVVAALADLPAGPGPGPGPGLERRGAAISPERAPERWPLPSPGRPVRPALLPSPSR